MATLVFTAGPLEGQKIEVSSSEATLGRSHRCDVPLSDGKASSEHALIRYDQDAGAWWIYDLQSSNGTRVNDKETTASHLHNGDRIGIGDSELLFSADGEDAPEQKRAAEGAPAAPPQELDLSDEQDDLKAVQALRDAYALMKEQVARVIVGQDAVVEEVLIAIFCRGHALLVGVPGVAKTLLVSTLSHVLDLSFKRVQFTPDLMPADITGTDVLEEDRTTGKRVFRFVKGPIFAHMVLADEINRTPPKTQAALLEAMQEHHVTVGERTYRLPEPFFVLATQNPIEQEGTYPLPEAQLDRFMFNIIVDYPSADEERDIIKRVTAAHQADIEVALTAEQVLQLQQIVRRVPVAEHVIEYARDLARMTRPKDETAPDYVKEMVSWGAGPRAGIYLITAAKARAVLHGRYHATTEDVKAVAPPVLRHRVITTFNAEAAGISSDDIVTRAIEDLKPRQDVDL